MHKVDGEAFELTQCRAMNEHDLFIFNLSYIIQTHLLLSLQVVLAAAIDEALCMY